MLFDTRLTKKGGSGPVRLGNRFFLMFVLVLAGFSGVHWLAKETSPQVAAIIVVGAWLLAKLLNYLDAKNGWTDGA